MFFQLFAAFGLAFFIKESDGPFDVMSRIRNKLITNKYVGVFFSKLLDCIFCLGFWTGIITGLAFYTNIFMLLLSGFAAAAFSMFVQEWILSLYPPTVVKSHPEEPPK